MSTHLLNRVVVLVPEWHTHGSHRRPGEPGRERHSRGAALATRRLEVDASDRPAPTVQTVRGGMGWIVEYVRNVSGAGR